MCLVYILFFPSVCSYVVYTYIGIFLFICIFILRKWNYSVSLSLFFISSYTAPYMLFIPWLGWFYLSTVLRCACNMFYSSVFSEEVAWITSKSPLPSNSVCEQSLYMSLWICVEISLAYLTSSKKSETIGTLSPNLTECC